MEAQEILKTPIGTIEPEKKTLKPAKVMIVNVSIEHIEKAKADKAVFKVKHPDKEETVNISSVSFLDEREIITVGTWINMDNKNKLQKGSGTARLLNKIGVQSLQEAQGKEIDTELDERGYLCFKAY